MTKTESGEFISKKQINPDFGEKLDVILEEDVDKKLANKRFEQDTKERKLLSHWVVWVVSVWLFLVIGVLILTGCCRCVDISDTVLCMLLGTTTINILGLAYIVLKGLFPESHKTQ
jgi:hypothetical protein